MRKVPVWAVIGLMAALGLLGLRVAPVAASDIRSGDTVIIGSGQLIDDDLIIAADTIEINGTVTGDLVAVARLITINGVVGGSAMLAGQTVDIFGQVGGSLYGAAYSLTLEEGAVVTRNGYLAGYNLATRPDSQVVRDLRFAGAQALHDGLVRGDLDAGVSALEINGQVGGNVEGNVTPGVASLIERYWQLDLPNNIETLAPGLVVGPEARIGGQQLVRESGLNIRPLPERNLFGLPWWIARRVGEGIGLLIVAVLIINAAPRFLPALSDVLQRRPLASTGWGALVYIVGFPLAILLGLALIGLVAYGFDRVTLGRYTLAVLGLGGGLFAFALFAMLFLVYIVAWIIIGHFVGRALLLRAGSPPVTDGTQLLHAAVGVLLFQLVRMVPGLSFGAALLVGSLTLGAMFVYVLERRRAEPVPKGAAAPTGD